MEYELLDHTPYRSFQLDEPKRRAKRQRAMNIPDEDRTAGRPDGQMS